MTMSLREQNERLNTAISKVTSLYGKWAKKHGLNYNSLMVLYAMEDGTCRTQKSISEHWMLPKTTVNAILSDFKSKGYVVYSTDESDKREKIITFTNEGKSYASAILCQLHEIEESVLKEMGPLMSQQMIEGNIYYSECFERAVENE